ncbi:MAG: hypothetical protein QOD75_928 [Blastocatellia bacterium]|nr:hypothetical protein [Blastocatellia bacterium]
MPAGLDAWPSANLQCPADSGWLIREERLETRLGVSHFRLPPDFRDPEPGIPHTLQRIPFVRFPRWHYCYHCGSMDLLSPFSASAERCKGPKYDQKSCDGKPVYRRSFLIPVRFVAVCGRGHIQDFPFFEWVHRDSSVQPDCRLRLRAGRSSAGLSGITVQCSCGQRKTLGDVFRFDEKDGGPLSKIGCQCKGMRPWLGDMDSGSQTCGQHLRVLQRGASNVYFPHVVSSLYLPLWAEKVDRDIITVLEEPHIWSQITSSTLAGQMHEERCRWIAEALGLDPDRFVAAARKKHEGQPLNSSGAVATDEEDFRRSEYRALCDARGGEKTELYIQTANMTPYDSDVGQHLSRVQLVHKLRETRALAGFTRILPPDGSLASDRLQDLNLDPNIDWLPAIKVYGEGLFLELNSDAIDRWLKRESAIVPRIAALAAHYNAIRTLRGQPQRNVTAKFVLLHTLAHVLINQLSFDCGYGSASLRERLYCNFIDSARSMHAVLIYTASGDSEGTMGGLVRQGRHGRLEATLRGALRHAAWCSSDPVCMESAGQGADSANLAACHGCCLLPETSCEEGNRLLDRALLVGTPERPKLGFFREPL